MQAHPQTKGRVGAVAKATATRCRVSSPTLDGHKYARSGFACAHIHAHRHGLNHMVRVGNECDFQFSLESLLTASSPSKTSGACGLRTLSHCHWSSLSLAMTDRRVRGSSPFTRLNFASARRAGCASHSFPLGFTGANPTAVRTMRDQQPINLTVRVIHHLKSPLLNLVCCIKQCTQARTNNWLSHPKKSRVK